MEEKQKEQFEIILQGIKNNNNNLAKKLSVYLQSKDLLEGLYSKLYYIIEKSEPIYKIKYYKSKINGKLLSVSDVKNSYNLLKDNLEDYIVYVYDEIRILHFKGEEVGKDAVRCQECSKSYENLVIKTESLSKNNNFEEVDWIKIIKENPLLFVYIIKNYNIDIEELNNVDEKSYTYKKEIKKN